MGWGSSTRRGGGRKLRALPRNLSSLGFEERNLGYVGIFAGMSRTPGGVRKVRAKKARAHLSFPKSGTWVDNFHMNTSMLKSQGSFLQRSSGNTQRSQEEDRGLTRLWGGGVNRMSGMRAITNSWMRQSMKKIRRGKKRTTIGDKIIAYRSFRSGELFSVIVTGNFTA